MGVVTEAIRMDELAASRGEWWRCLKRNRAALAGLFLLSSFLLLAGFAPLIAPYSPTQQVLEVRLSPPSFSHLFGTDDLGRDTLSRVIYGARISVSVGISLLFGTPLGAAAGYCGGRVNQVIMRMMDVLLAFPGFLLAVLIVGSFGPSLENAMAAIGIVGIPTYARLARSSVMAVKEEAFVEAASAPLGAGRSRILFRHIFPSCLAPLIVQSSLGFGTAILETAGLSFLGLGAQPPAPEWGATLAGGRAWILTAPWIVAFPGLAILCVVLGFNLLGDGLRDTLNGGGA